MNHMQGRNLIDYTMESARPFCWNPLSGHRRHIPPLTAWKKQQNKFSLRGPDLSVIDTKWKTPRRG
jgi:hypothetical protein